MNYWLIATNVLLPLTIHVQMHLSQIRECNDIVRFYDMGNLSSSTASPDPGQATYVISCDPTPPMQITDISSAKIEITTGLEPVSTGFVADFWFSGAK